MNYETEEEKGGQITKGISQEALNSPEDPGSEEPPPLPVPRAHRGSDVLTARHPWWCSAAGSLSAAGAGAAAAASILRLVVATNGFPAAERNPASAGRPPPRGGRTGSSRGAEEDGRSA